MGTLILWSFAEGLVAAVLVMLWPAGTLLMGTHDPDTNAAAAACRCMLPLAVGPVSQRTGQQGLACCCACQGNQHGRACKTRLPSCNEDVKAATWIPTRAVIHSRRVAGRYVLTAVTWVSREELKKLGPLSRNEKITAGALAVTVGLWIFGGQVGVNAVAAALLGLAIMLITNVVRISNTTYSLAEMPSHWCTGWIHDGILHFTLYVSLSAQAGAESVATAEALSASY